MRRYRNDPKWITAKFGQCKECKTDLKGKEAYFYPLTKDIYCNNCGQKHAADFNMAAQDEEFYQSLYPNY